MKTLAKIWLTAFLVAIAAMASAKGQMAPPMQKQIAPGISTVEYAGQQLRFSTSQSLIVKFESLDGNRIKLTVRVYGASRAELGRQNNKKDDGSQNYTATATVDIFWENFGTEIYNGSLYDPYEGILNSESGFTEK